MLICSICRRTVEASTDAQLGLIFKESGWALVNYSRVCPECKDRLIEINRIENEKNHQKWLESKKGD